MRVLGIEISDEQVTQFLERLARKYQGWEIEDIFNALLNKDISDFEYFVTGVYVDENELEEQKIKFAKLKEKHKKEISELEEEINGYITAIREYENRLTAAGSQHLILNTKTLQDIIENLEEEDDEVNHPD